MGFYHLVSAGSQPSSDADGSLCAALRPAQVHASADALKLITFDADGTLYADGAHMEQDNQMIAHIINLMRSNVQVSGA